MTKLTWHVAHTKPAAEWLAEAHLRAQGYRVLAPWYVAEVVRNRRLVVVRRPWFSRYVFVGLGPRQAIAPVNSTRGVSTVITIGEKPIEIPPLVMRELIDSVEFDQMVRTRETPDAPIEVGATHWITAGAFVDRLAKIADTVDEAGRLKVLIGQLRVSLPKSAIGAKVDSNETQARLDC